MRQFRLLFETDVVESLQLRREITNACQKCGQKCGTLHLAWIGSSTLVQLAFILVTLWNIPSLLTRSYKYLERHLTRSEVLVTKNSVDLNQVPIEILYNICRFMSPQSLCRISRSSSIWHLIASDDRVWAQQYYKQWPSDSLKSYASRRPRHTTYYAMFRIRWSSLGQSFEDGIKREDRLGWRKGILEDEFTRAFSRLFHFVLIPVKVLGFFTFPIFWVCDRFLTVPATPSLCCLRYLVLDLNYFAKRCLSVTDLHLFFAANLGCLFLLVLEELSVVIAGIYCLLLTIATGAPVFHNRVATDYPLSTKVAFILWQLVLVPVILMFHVQLVFLPISFVYNVSLHFLITKEPLVIQSTWVYLKTSKFMTSIEFFNLVHGWIKGHPKSSSILLQIIWAPVMCSVEEVTFRYSSSQLQWVPEWHAPLLLIQKLTRCFTLAVQCCFGGLVYILLILVSFALKVLP